MLSKTIQIVVVKFVVVCAALFGVQYVLNDVFNTYKANATLIAQNAELEQANSGLVYGMRLFEQNAKHIALEQSKIKEKIDKKKRTATTTNIGDLFDEKEKQGGIDLVHDVFHVNNNRLFNEISEAGDYSDAYKNYMSIAPDANNATRTDIKSTHIQK